MTNKRPSVDWEKIEAEYRAGQLSIREIAKGGEVSHVAILKKAKANGWTQNLAERVREAVTSKLVTSEVTNANASAAQVVEEASTRVVQVIGQHKVRISRGQKIVEKLFGELENGASEASTKDKSITLNNLSTSLKTLIGLERQAFNLEDGRAPTDPTNPTEAVSARERIAGKIARLSTGNGPNGDIGRTH